MSADASHRAAVDRPGPSGPAAGTRHAGGPVPPPRTAPPVESTPPPDAEPPAGPESPATVGQATPEAATEPAPEAATQPALTEREQRILAFEAQWWKHAGAKEQAIRDTFGLSATRYYQLLNVLLDHPAALAAEPVLVGRLRRLRSSRARNRRR
ncbi:DUF3263 domain-containing protein [Micromonospora chalcea]|uniref:DUF3263 domain-containing protein n=1 Tax=Micromonospora chalcea TaxID=1874 RepID=UPI0004C416E2|nr:MULTISPECIES: DUF3263 domain-containing protein [Micromonospora]MCT2281057.1 DUF3263 domain-containing protein [Micromonospora chalcea]